MLSVSDQVLCAHVRLQHILEEFESQLSSASGPTAVNVAHRVAKRQLAEWAIVVPIWNGKKPFCWFDWWLTRGKFTKAVSVVRDALHLRIEHDYSTIHRLIS